MKITYNNIINEIKTFAQNHFQVNEFDNGDLWEVIQHNQFADFLYPLVYVVDAGGNLEQGAVSLSFDVLCMDLVHKGEKLNNADGSDSGHSQENEVKSDTLQILLDLVAHLEKLTDDKFYFAQIEKTSTLESFTERFDDELTGWKINITIKQPLTYDSCAIPN